MAISMNPDRQISVMIADDNPAVREALAAIINFQPDMQVVALASNGKEAIECFYKACPDIILMDLRMPVIDGIEASRRISRMSEQVCIIALTNYEGNQEVKRAREAGMRAYLLKGVATEELLNTLRLAFSGQITLSPMRI